MINNKCLDISEELLVQHHNRGIKLVRPDDKRFNLDNNMGHSVKTLLQSPINIIFLNHHSVIQNINENNVITCGYSSIKDAYGKTIRDAYCKKSADFSINHDVKVLAHNNMIIKEEYCERIDEIAFWTLTAKLPWYDNDNSIKGILGCSIAIGLNGMPNVHDTLISFMQLDIFKRTATKSSKQRFLPGSFIGDFYFTKREAEVLRLVVRGKTAKEIAIKLSLSPRTIETYLATIKIKTNSSTKSELIDKVMDYFIFHNH
jgi:DNA-binding CsgD family transcriptional regulator